MSGIFQLASTDKKSWQGARNSTDYNYVPQRAQGPRVLLPVTQNVSWKCSSMRSRHLTSYQLSCLCFYQSDCPWHLASHDHSSANRDLKWEWNPNKSKPRVCLRVVCFQATTVLLVRSDVNGSVWQMLRPRSAFITMGFHASLFWQSYRWLL